MTAETEPARTPDPDAVRRYQANLDDEIDGIAIYRLLAAAEPDAERRKIFEALAGTEERHANVWRQKLREMGVEPREHGPSLRVRFIGWLGRRFGVRSVLGIVRSMEAGAYSVYMAQDETAQAIAPDEREHNRRLSRLERTEAEPVGRSRHGRRGTAGAGAGRCGPACSG